MIKFCPMCGNKLGNAKICRGCGLSVRVYEEKLAKLSATVNEDETNDKTKSKEFSSEKKLSSNELLNMGHKALEEKDFENALRYYIRAAAAGNTDAMYQIGEMYYYGRGVAANIVKAREWYKKSGKDKTTTQPNPKSTSQSASKSTAKEKVPTRKDKKTSPSKDTAKVANDSSADITPKPTEKSSSTIQSDTPRENTAIVTATEPAQDENTFSILSYKYTFHSRFAAYNAVRRIFVANAYKKRKEFSSEYNERVHNFDEFYSVGIKIFERKIFDTADLSVDLIKRIRGINIPPEEILRICYNERLIQIDKFLIPLKKVYDEMVAAAEQIAAYRGLERSSRSRWEGGGFGFTGAIKGAIKAGILNMATDAVRGIGDSFTDASDRKKIAKLKAQALNNENFYNGQSMLQYTENTLENFCLNFFDGIMPIIALNYVLTKDDINLSEQIIYKIANYRPYKFNELIEATFRNPFEPVLYLTIFNLHPGSYHELERLAEYVGLREKFLDMLALWYLKEIFEFAPTEKDTVQTIQTKKDNLNSFRTDLDYGIFAETKKLMNTRLDSFEKELREKNNKKDDDCFITTAVCLSFGKADDCHELTTFRKFRDTWLVKQPDGKNLIAEYYAVAPIIVDKINRLANSSQLYQEIWNIFLKPCLENIEHGRFLECKKIYIAMVKQLKKIFIG